MLNALREVREVKRTVKNWWLFTILGVLLTAGGIYVAAQPAASYVTLAIFFSALVFVNGIFDLVFSISNRKVLKGWGWYLAGGILEVLAGIGMMIYPQISLAILPFVLGFWLMFGGISTIASSVELRNYRVKGWGWMLALGILLSIVSFIIIANPVIGAGAVVGFTSVAIIAYGISYIVFSFQLKRIKDTAKDIKKTFINGLGELKNEVIAAVAEEARKAEAEEEQPNVAPATS